MCQIPKNKFAPYHLSPHHHPLAIFFQNVPRFCFLRFMYKVHGILFFLQIHVPGYMKFCFFFNSMYQGYMNLRKQNLGTFWKKKLAGGGGAGLGGMVQFFLSSPIAYIACERTELLKTQISGCRCRASKLF